MFEQAEDGTLRAVEAKVEGAAPKGDAAAEPAPAADKKDDPKVVLINPADGAAAKESVAEVKTEVKDPAEAKAPEAKAPDAKAADAKAAAAKAPDGKPVPKASAIGAPGSIPLEKSYRVNVIAGSSGGWSTISRVFMAPPRYKTDYLQVKLYAYMPTMDMNSIGKAYWDDVIVRPLSPADASAWIAKQKPKKDKRFSEGVYKSKKDKEKGK